MRYCPHCRKLINAISYFSRYGKVVHEELRCELCHKTIAAYDRNISEKMAREIVRKLKPEIEKFENFILKRHPKVIKKLKRIINY